MNIGMYGGLVFLAIGLAFFLVGRWSNMVRSLGVSYIVFGVVGFSWSWAIHIL